MPNYVKNIVTVSEETMNKIKEKYINRSKILIDIMNKLGFKGDSYSGAFYLFFKVPNYFDNMLIKDANEFAFLIKKKEPAKASSLPNGFYE